MRLVERRRDLNELWNGEVCRFEVGLVGGNVADDVGLLYLMLDGPRVRRHVEVEGDDTEPPECLILPQPVAELESDVVPFRRDDASLS